MGSPPLPTRGPLHKLDGPVDAAEQTTALVDDQVRLMLSPVVTSVLLSLRPSVAVGLFSGPPVPVDSWAHWPLEFNAHSASRLPSTSICTLEPARSGIWSLLELVMMIACAEASSAIP